MRRVIAVMPKNDIDETERGLVHYDGVFIIGSATLCGHTDRVKWEWPETTKRVNCRGCIAIRNHVLGKPE